MYQNQLQNHGRELGSIALALVAIRREVTGAETEIPTQNLGHAVTRFMIAVARMRESGMLLDSPTRTAPSALAFLGHEQPYLDNAIVDTYSAFLFGDLLLDDFARVELHRRTSGNPSDAQPACSKVRGWPLLVCLLDRYPDDPMTGAARYLNINLRGARNNLVAHVPETHVGGTGHGDGLVTIDRFALPDVDGEPYAGAVRLLRQALRVAANGQAPWDEYQVLAHQASNAATTLNWEQAGKVMGAFRMAGVDAPPMPVIVTWVIGLLRAHLDARGIAPITLAGDL